MAKRELCVRRRAGPRVLLALPGTGKRQIHAIVEVARDWQWDLLDIVMTRGYIPPDPPPSGAIIDCRPTQRLARRMRALGIPVVRLGWRPHAQDRLLPAVVPDHAAAGRLAAMHFSERGFRHVAYEASVLWADARPLYHGFRLAARELGLACERFRVSGSPPALPLTRTTAAEHERRARQIGRWPTALPKPVGILSLSASMLCTICQRVGLAVPEDVALLGVGNHLLPCELSPVPLSSIDTAAEEQARQAAILLHRLMNGASAPTETVMIRPRGVVTRRSTDVLAVADRSVAEAMRYMWAHLDLDLSVADIAAHAGVPVRTLQRAFRRHLGRGVIAELRRRRLQELRRRLRTTDLPIAALARQVGFRTLVHMHKCFRHTYGMTPRQYRNQFCASQARSAPARAPSGAQ